MTGFGILAIFLGAMLIALVGWKTFGVVVVIYGLLCLFLAYHLAVAPCVEELERGDLIRRRSELNAEGDDILGELPSQWLADY
jgi:hypothetical protein